MLGPARGVLVLAGAAPAGHGALHVPGDDVAQPLPHLRVLGRRAPRAPCDTGRATLARGLTTAPPPEQDRFDLVVNYQHRTYMEYVFQAHCSSKDSEGGKLCALLPVIFSDEVSDIPCS